MAKHESLVGLVVDGTEVISYSHSDKGVYYNCLCSCGNACVIKASRIGEYHKKGKKLGCGCKAGKDGIHMNTGKPLYPRYRAMISRCYNEENTSYVNYGGRGIKVCDRWLDPSCGFTNFLSDMEDQPENYTLERIDVNGDYCPENCKWEDHSSQSFNRRVLPGNTSGVTGVGFVKKEGRWKAYISKGWNFQYLGYFDTLFEAVCVRKSAELALYPYKFNLPVEPMAREDMQSLSRKGWYTVEDIEYITANFVKGNPSYGVRGMAKKFGVVPATMRALLLKLNLLYAQQNT